VLQYKDTCYNWTELNTNNSKIGPWGRDLLGVQFKSIFSFFLSLSATIPSSEHSKRLAWSYCGNTLQFTVTYCSSLQLFATHCNTIHCTTLLAYNRLALPLCMLEMPCMVVAEQQTASRYHTLQHAATHCNTLQLTATHYLSGVWQTRVAHRYTPNDLHSCSEATHCNSLQPTATHCNTLQLTATHCNTLQHTILLAYNRLALSVCIPQMPCIVVARQHPATRCNSLQLTATCCNSLQHTATHCNSLS